MRGIEKEGEWREIDRRGPENNLHPCSLEVKRRVSVDQYHIKRWPKPLVKNMSVSVVTWEDHCGYVRG